MKKLAIIGGAILLAGLVLFTAGYFISGCDYSVLNMRTERFIIDLGGSEAAGEDDSAGGTGVRREYTLSPEGVDAIAVKDTDADVKLGISTDGLIHIYCYEYEEDRYTITEGAILRIERDSTRAWFKWTFRIDWDSEDSSLTILLPEELASSGADLSISTSSGDIRLSQGMFFGKTELSTTSGDIEAENLQGQQLSASSTSGEISLEKAEFDSGITLSSTSGEVEADSCKTSGDFLVSTTSGGIELRDTDAVGIFLSTTSGEVRCGYLTADTVAIESTSGGQRFDLISARSSVDFSTVSGEVSGTLAGRTVDYTISVSTVSGDSNLPNGLRAGSISLHAESTSGDIQINFWDD
ncbi:MAG: DUF4097 family beta strand repeat-containing protein [Oscillospiraceae bacterium]